MSQKGSISPGQLGKPKTPWCWAPKVMRFLIWGCGHRWATARRNWPPWEERSVITYNSAAMLSCSHSLILSFSHLGEADGVVAALKLWVLSQHLTHLPHLPVRGESESQTSHIFSEYSNSNSACLFVSLKKPDSVSMMMLPPIMMRWT